MTKTRKFWLTWIAVFIILLTLILTTVFYKPTPVNGNDTTSQPNDTKIKRTYLGKEIYHNNVHAFYYYGVLNFEHTSLTYTLDHIVIGVRRYTAIGNIFIKVEKDMIFKLGSKTFRLVDYTRDWIELEEQ